MLGRNIHVVQYTHGGDYTLGYTVKWVEDHLGITRSAIKYYESKKLISKQKSRNENNYRDFDDDDIDRIWGIKILLGIGFNASEVYELMNNQELDFYEAISNKVSSLEEEMKEKTAYLEFAKSIKLTGRVPTASVVGSIRYEDFIEYAHKNWNFYKDSTSSPYIDIIENLSKPEKRSIEEIDIDKLEAIADIFQDYEETKRTCEINAYYALLANLTKYDYRDEVVQTVVRLLFEYLSNDKVAIEIGEKFNEQFFAKYTASFFVDGGDLAKINIMNFGEERCLFIANAIAYFGGYENLDDL